MLTDSIKRPNVRWLLLLLPVLLLAVVSCDPTDIKVWLKCDTLDPVHMLGKRIEPGETVYLCTVGMQQTREIPIVRMDVTRAVLKLQSARDPEESGSVAATVTLSEWPYWHFSASSDEAYLLATIE